MLRSEEVTMAQTLKIEGTEGTAAAVSNVSPERITIPVTGMTCAACQSFVQRTLASQAGVKDAAVNLMLHNATVTFDPGVTSVSALVDTIRGTGYGAEIPAQHSSILAEQAEHDEEQLREYGQLRLKAVVSVTAGFFAMILSMPLMSMSRAGGMEGMRDPLMSWNMRVLDPVLRKTLPWMYRVSDDAIRWFLFALAAFILGWGGSGHRGCFPLFCSGHDCAWVLRCAWHRP
jgi:P-type Cu+ transporter